MQKGLGMEKDQEHVAADQDDQNSDSKIAGEKPAHKQDQAKGEIGGPAGLEPTRYGDWERKGIISDF